MEINNRKITEEECLCLKYDTGLNRKIKKYLDLDK